MASNTHTPQSLPNTLHYGSGGVCKSGKLKASPNGVRRFKTQKRFECIVRMENAGFTEAQAASIIGISTRRYKAIKQEPDYLIARTKITHGIILDWDGELETIREQRKELLVQALPPALQVLMNEIQRPAVTLAERKHQTQVAQDLLDREGTYAKISRAEIKPVDTFEFEKYDAASKGILAALRGSATPPLGQSGQPLLGPDGEPIAPFGIHAAASIEANDAFSNSHTLSQTDQEKALAELEAQALLEGIDLTKPAN